MEQQEPRRYYVNNIISYLRDIVKINDGFMDELKKHSDQEYIKEVDKLDTDMEKKIFIFLEFTRERSTCNEMIKILEKCGQNRAAQLLSGFNASPEFLGYTYDTHLTVIQTMKKKSGGSKYFEMDGTPKGVFFIINNVKDVAEKESHRFKDVFEQIGFNAKRLETDNALVVMIISHGRDEKIVCKDNTEIGIAEVIEYFSDTKCPILANKPKIFIFNCCRTKTNYGQFMRSTTRDQKWKNNNKYTMICYACSEGLQSWYIPGQYTHFGQALSHCLAQYACDKSAQYILNTANERMKPYGDVEIRPYTSNRELFLNPGVKKFSFN